MSPITVITGDGFPEQDRTGWEQYNIGLLVEDRQEEFPLTWLATRKQEPARSTTIRWGKPLKVNYCQIWRFPYLPAHEGSSSAEGWNGILFKEELVDRLLKSVELQIEWGTPQRSEWTQNKATPGIMGGFRHYLGDRPIQTDDQLTLVVLRQPMLRSWEDPGGTVSWDLVFEASLKCA